MDESIDDSFTDDRILKQLKPTLRLDLFLNCGKDSPPGSADDSSFVAAALSESAFGQLNCASCRQDKLVPFPEGLSVEVSALVRSNTG